MAEWKYMKYEGPLQGAWDFMGEALVFMGTGVSRLQRRFDIGELVSSDYIKTQYFNGGHSCELVSGMVVETDKNVKVKVEYEVIQIVDCTKCMCPMPTTEHLYCHECDEDLAGEPCWETLIMADYAIDFRNGEKAQVFTLPSVLHPHTVADAARDVVFERHGRPAILYEMPDGWYLNYRQPFSFSIFIGGSSLRYARNGERLSLDLSDPDCWDALDAQIG